MRINRDKLAIVARRRKGGSGRPKRKAEGEANPQKGLQ